MFNRLRKFYNLIYQLNRTYVELKFITVVFLLWQSSKLNRTYVELKCTK